MNIKKIIQRMKQIGPIHQNRLKFDQSSDLPYILSIKMKESLTKPIKKHETLKKYCNPLNDTK